MEKLLQEHLEYIRELGFIIQDEEKVVGYLRGVGYYRLRRYFNIFAQKKKPSQMSLNQRLGRS